MSLADDLCDWCGGYVDPIGGDMARAASSGRLWCGVCPLDTKTRTFVFGLTDEEHQQVTEMLARMRLGEPDE